MAQITATVRVPEVAAPAAAADAAPPSQRAQNRAVVVAVRALNERNYAGEGREVTFSVDRATHLPVVKVVDSDTKEVLEQWPQKYVLNLAEDLTQTDGIHDESLL